MLDKVPLALFRRLRHQLVFTNFDALLPCIFFINKRKKCPVSSHNLPDLLQ